MNKTVETALAEGGMVPGDLDDRFGFALGAVHGFDLTGSTTAMQCQKRGRNCFCLLTRYNFLT